MTDLRELEQRIERIESRIAIEELHSHYAIACDEHDMSQLVALFIEGAVFDSPSGFMRARGRAEIHDMFVALFRIRGPGYHWTHDAVIRFDNESNDRATGTVLSHAETTPNGIVSLAGMKYDDNYQRVNGKWLFSKRVIKFLYYVPAEKYSQGLNSPKRLFVNDEWLNADYPEQLDAWQAFERDHG